MAQVNPDAPVFAIAVAAELSGMHPQTLRQYDRIGLVVPGRTRGGSRRYSVRNIEQLREVAQLSAEGMSLPAIARLLDLEDEVRRLRHRVTELEHELHRERTNRPGVRVFAAGSTGQVIPVSHGRRIRRPTEVVLWSPRPPQRSDDQEDDQRG